MKIISNHYKSHVVIRIGKRRELHGDVVNGITARRQYFSNVVNEMTIRRYSALLTSLASISIWY